MNHDLAVTASLIDVPLGTLQRWLDKYILPVGTLNSDNGSNEWTFSDTDVQVLRGMYEKVQFGDRTAFVIKKQFRNLLRRRPKSAKAKGARPTTPASDPSRMHKRVAEMQARWPEVPIRTLLWVTPEKREEFVQKVREGYLTLAKASKIVKLSDAHLRQYALSSAKRFFPNTLRFPMTGKRAGLCLLHPDDVEKFRQFHTRPEGMLSIEDSARYTGMHASTIRNGLREKTLKADAVVDGHIKLFKKETLDAFKTFVRTRVRATPKPRPKPKARRMDRPSTPIAPPPKKHVFKKAPKPPLSKARMRRLMDDLPPAAPPPPPVPVQPAPRKLMLDGSRLVYMNAYGVAEEAKVVLRLRKDRGILIVVDAAGCEVDPELRKAVGEALNLDIWWSYDTDGSIVPWLSPE